MTFFESMQTSVKKVGPKFFMLYLDWGLNAWANLDIVMMSFIE